VLAAGTVRRSEASQSESVRRGEFREELLADLIAAWVQRRDGGTVAHAPRSSGSDIDRVLRRNGVLHGFFEVKERTCSLNAYAETMFPYAKIDAASQLHQTYGAPVDFFLQFTDCLAVHRFDPARTYQKGSQPFAPSYRPGQRDRPRQVPVLLQVEHDFAVVPVSADLRLPVVPFRLALLDVHGLHAHLSHSRR
jgi:hypothetical protein